MRTKWMNKGNVKIEIHTGLIQPVFAHENRYQLIFSQKVGLVHSGICLKSISIFTNYFVLKRKC